MSVKLLTEHSLEFLSLKGGCRGSSESTLVKMPHCWKSHATLIYWSYATISGFLAVWPIYSYNSNQSELSRTIPWNQTSDVHRRSTLITWRWRYITWRLCHRNHANTIPSAIEAKLTVINEMKFMFFFFVFFFFLFFFFFFFFFFKYRSAD